MRTIAALMILLFWIFGVIGWVCNIITLFSLPSLNGEAFIRLVGIIIAPLGAVLGYI